MIAPPYSTEFVQLFLPIVRNEEITGRLRNADRTDDVSLFLGERGAALIERLSLTFTANGKRQKQNFCRLSSALCTVESKHLYLQ